MAHRNGRADSFPVSATLGLLVQTEKGKPVPARACHRRSDGTQRLVLLAVVLEAVFENLHANCLSLIPPFEGGSGLGKTRIAPWPAGPLLDVGVCQRAPELSRCPQPQIHVR